MFRLPVATHISYLACMSLSFPNLSNFLDHGFDDLIDVRSPAEFETDHIPGAINLPALNNDERAQVGALYVQDSPFKARKIGAALVAANAARHLQGPLAEKPGSWRPLVYCWRGGQRSGSMASIFSQIGWRADTIEGGYQSYRRCVVRELYGDMLDLRIVLLEGFTGTAKTEVLHRHAENSHQVLDLEGLAEHRGSIFGNLSNPQPSQKHFETRLALALNQFDTRRPVLVEAESSKIGAIFLPPALWKAMQHAPRLRIEAPLYERAEYLTSTYKDITCDPKVIGALIDKLRQIHSKEQITQWRKMISNGEMTELAVSLMSRHYDPRYRKSARPAAATLKLDALNSGDIDRAAQWVDRSIQEIL